MQEGKTVIAECRVSRPIRTTRTKYSSPIGPRKNTTKIRLRAYNWLPVEVL